MKISRSLKILFWAISGRNPQAKTLLWEFSRYFLVEKFAGLIFPEFKVNEFCPFWMKDKEFINWFQSFHGKSDFRSMDRKFTLNQLIKLTLHLQGDTAECGSYEGASSFLICKNIFGSEKTHYIFDSFEGLSEPGEFDGIFWKKGYLSMKEESCRKRLREFDFVKIYKGWIPSRFDEVSRRKFSFVHVDVDLFQPTFDSLNFFYPRMVPGGIILCDDYGSSTCVGANKSMKDFFRYKPEKIVSLTTGQGFIVKF